MPTFRLALLATCLTACVFSPAPAHADGLDGARGTAIAGIDVRNLRLTRGDGTPFADADFASATLSSNGNLFATANGSDLFRFVFPALEPDSFLCAGEACPTPPVPVASAQTPSGDTAYSQLRAQNWGDLQHQAGAAQTLAAASFNDRPSLSAAFVDATFRFVLCTSADLTWSLDASAYALAEVDAGADAVAKANLVFDMFLTDFTTGETLLLVEPAALNRDLEAAADESAEYASGPVHLTFAVTGLQPGHDYRLALNQISAAEVPEPRMTVLLAAGLLVLLVPGLRAGGRRGGQIMRARAAWLVALGLAAVLPAPLPAAAQSLPPNTRAVAFAGVDIHALRSANEFADAGLDAETIMDAFAGPQQQAIFVQPDQPETLLCSGAHCPAAPVPFSIAATPAGDTAFTQLRWHAMDDFVDSTASAQGFATAGYTGAPGGDFALNRVATVIQFELAQDTPLMLTLDATPLAYAAVDPAFSGEALAHLYFEILLYDPATREFVWDLRPAALNHTLSLAAGEQELYAPGRLTVQASASLPRLHLYQLFITQVSVAQVPEPGMGALLVLGLAVVGLHLRRRRAAGSPRTGPPARAGKRPAHRMFRPLAAVLGMLAAAPLALAGNVTAIVELSRPGLLHTDGRPYTPSELVLPEGPFAAPLGTTGAGGQYSYFDGSSIQSRQHNVLCNGPTCPAEPIGLARGRFLPAGPDTAYAEYQGVNTPDLYDGFSDLQYQALRTDIVGTGTGGDLRAAIGNTWTIDFLLRSPDRVTVIFNARSLVRVLTDGSEPATTTWVADTRLTVLLMDQDTGQELFVFAPDAVQFHAALPGGRSREQLYDPETDTYTVTSPVLDPSHRYALQFSQSVLAAMVPVPEPARLWLACAGGLVLLLRHRRGRAVLLAGVAALGLAAPARADSGASAVLQVQGLLLQRPGGSPATSADLLLADAAAGGTFGTQAPDGSGFHYVTGLGWHDDWLCSGRSCATANVPLPAAGGSLGSGDLSYARRITRGQDALLAAAYHEQNRTDAAAHALGQSAASLTSTFGVVLTSTHDEALTIAFIAIPSLLASIDGGTAPGARASAHIGMRVALIDVLTAQEIFVFAPPELNRTIALDAPGTASVDPGPLGFVATTGMLSSGRRYQLTLLDSTLALASVPVPGVPEPAQAVLYLGGLALLLAWQRCGGRARARRVPVDAALRQAAYPDATDRWSRSSTGRSAWTSRARHLHPAGPPGWLPVRQRPLSGPAGPVLGGGTPAGDQP